ncbi:AAA family ATPase [Flavobacterium covae]|nr:AAA family ATPase [Flavobacterium covae]QYS90912.1 AAA family ATPase [Flavobacterium covae]
MKPQFLIAAPSSNSGKTTITLGLLRLLKNNGYKVQPFKCGPDYIDTKHHTKAAGEPSINLDTYMMSESHVKTLYKKYSQEADISIIEGVMGLFDGANRMEGSSAEIALLLNIPIILVVNAKSMAYSVAPLLFGLKNFNPKIKIAGVIFNFVNTESHYSF